MSVARSFRSAEREVNFRTDGRRIDPVRWKGNPQEIYAYQRKVGSLLYATIITRPDAARTANKLSYL